MREGAFPFHLNVSNLLTFQSIRSDCQTVRPSKAVRLTLSQPLRPLHAGSERWLGALRRTQTPRPPFVELKSDRGPSRMNARAHRFRGSRVRLVVKVYAQGLARRAAPGFHLEPATMCPACALHVPPDSETRMTDSEAGIRKLISGNRWQCGCGSPDFPVETSLSGTWIVARGSESGAASSDSELASPSWSWQLPGWSSQSRLSSLELAAARLGLATGSLELPV